MHEITTAAAGRFTDEILISWDSSDPYIATAREGLSEVDEETLFAYCQETNEDYATAEAEVMAFIADRVAGMSHTFEARDEAEGDTTLDALDMDEAVSEAEDWCRSGEWGNDGASIVVWVTERDAAGGEVDERRITVEIEPNHENLISWATRRCGAGESCGESPDDHNWTSEGEGGCDQNPGVWSTGGTSMLFASHCRDCGLRKRYKFCGSQRNPGEHDRVEYSMPDSWCAECEREECTCGTDED